jgi:hypothetical protein
MRRLGRSSRDIVVSLDVHRAEGGAPSLGPGGTDVIVGFRWPYHTGPDTEPVADKIGKLRRYAAEVIGKVRN